MIFTFKLTWKTVLWRLLAYSLMFIALWGVLEVPDTLPWYRSIGGCVLIFIACDILSYSRGKS